MQWTAWGGWLAALAWLLLRAGGQERTTWGYDLGLGGSQAYLYFDWSWVLLLVAAALLARKHPSERAAWAATCVLTLFTFWEHVALALTRYYAGRSLAWDLANYVQPLWRTAHGLDMTSAVYDGRPIWADHGAFAMFLFAPLTRIASDAATGLLVAESMLSASSVIACFGLARALSLSPYVALCATAVHSSSRALAHAASFDFHPECALPLLLLATAWLHEKSRWPAAVACTIVAISLRDMAALTLAMLWLYWTLTTRDRRAFAVALGCFAVAAFDVFALPPLTGWYSYLALNTSAPVDLGRAASSFALRSLSTFGVGWLHPIAWFAGAPWALASALSPKLAVKGIDFQYGFLYVPVATLGALHVLRWFDHRRPQLLPPLVCVWVAAAVAVNAPAAASLRDLAQSKQLFDALHRELARQVPPDAIVAADACAAPYAMERPHLTLLCRLDVDALQRTGSERWDAPVADSLKASHILVRKDCHAHRACIAEQLERAQRELGFSVIEHVGPFVVLARPSAMP